MPVHFHNFDFGKEDFLFPFMLQDSELSFKGHVPFLKPLGKYELVHIKSRVVPSVLARPRVNSTSASTTSMDSGRKMVGPGRHIFIGQFVCAFQD